MAIITAVVLDKEEIPMIWAMARGVKKTAPGPTTRLRSHSRPELRIIGPVAILVRPEALTHGFLVGLEGRLAQKQEV